MLALAAFVLTTQSRVSLKYLPPIGKPYRFRFSASTTQSVNGGTETKEGRVMDLTVKALSRSGDVTLVETRTSHAKVTIPAGSLMAGVKARMEKEMSGIVLQTRTDARYGVTGMVGTGVGGQKLQTQGDEMLGMMLGLRFPTRPVRIGESWTFMIDVNKALGGQGFRAGKIPVKLTLLSVKGGIARIASSIQGSSPLALEGQQMTISMAGKGWSTFEVGTGVLVESSLELKAKADAGSRVLTQIIRQATKRL